jgi:hypothetical protein
MKLLERYQAKIFGRVWIKGIGLPINGRAIYTSSIQAICGDFQRLLDLENNHGVIVADSRTPVLNSDVSHSIFTQKFRAAGDSYSRVLEMPTFGHSENHVGLQLADLLTSGLLFPIACYAYCSGRVNNIHVHAKYATIKAMFGPRLLALTYRYNEGGRPRGGITVDDKLAARNNTLMFN